MYRLFREGALAGGDLLSIESAGGQEIHDDALMYCDIKGALFALTVLEEIRTHEDAFIADMPPSIDTEKCILKEYGIEA